MQQHCAASAGGALESSQTWEPGRVRGRVHTGGGQGTGGHRGDILFPALAGAQVPAGVGWKLGPGNGAASSDSRPRPAVGVAPSWAAEST